MAREIHDEPSPDEAVSVLRALAESFLHTAARRPADEAPDEGGGDHLHPGTVLVDERTSAIRAVDRDAERLLGREAADLVGRPAEELFGKLPARATPTLHQLPRGDSAARSLWVTRSEVVLDGAPCAVLSLNPHDPSGGRRTELRYRHLVEQIPAVVFTAALDGGLYDLYVSPQIETLLGYSQEQWLADPVLWYERLHPEDRRKLDEEFARGCAIGGPFKADCRFYTRDDRVVWVHGEARLIRDASGLPLLLQGVAFDITDTKRAEEVARASLREKETLLKEIHHRVKNNLQVTSSLLKLQADRIDDVLAVQALREAQSRIRSMALVHELLYRSKDLSRVDLGTYIQDLTRQLLRAHAVDPSHIRVVTDLAPLSLAIDVAVPCGLILNELVSNALEHAFPDGRRGTISIELQRQPEFEELVVRDDGVGMAGNVDLATSTTLGLSLIRTLADQIGGTLAARADAGTEVRLRFPRISKEGS